MTLLKLFTILLALSIQSCFSQDYSQRTIIYEGSGAAGQYLIIPQTYAPNLALNGWDDRAQSACVTGTWLFYDDEGYNSGLNSGMEYIYGRNNYCANFQGLARRVTSVRYAGSPTDYTTDTLTLYEGTYFQGEEEYAVTDLPNLNSADNHQSIIVTGRSPWTLYDRPSYEGIAICVESPEPSTFTPAFISNVEDIDIPHGAIRSVRKGCFGKRPTKAYASPVQDEVSGFARGGRP